MARNRFLRRSVLMMTSTSTLVAVLLALVLVGAIALRSFDRLQRVRVAVGPTDSVDAQFGQALGLELPKGIGATRVDLVRLDSLSAVAEAVDDGKAGLAIVRSDVAFPDHAGTMLIVHKDAALFLTTAESKITDIAGLDRKKVGILPGNNANAALLDTVLTQNGIEPANVEHVRLQPDDLADALAKKTIDALVVVGPLASEQVRNAVEAVGDASPEDPVFLPLKNAEALEQGQFGFDKITVPAGMFAGAPPQPDDEIETIGVTYQLVASLDLPESAVAQLTRTIFALRRLLATNAPIASFMEAPDTEKGSRFPLHVGATSYYQDTEKSFMDRYGDWFYIVAMVAGGLGSAIASLVSSLQARSRRSAMAIIDQLATLRHKAVDCTETAGLRAIDNEVSALALVALGRAREGRFDQAGIDIMRLAIDETRRSLTRRLSELRSPAAGASRVTPPLPE